MNAQNRKPNTGALFKNEQQKTDKHPGYTGSANIDGVDYWMDAWVNKSQSGKTYFAFKFKKKEANPMTQGNYGNRQPAAPQPPPAQQQPQQQNWNMNSPGNDVPF